MFGLLYVIKADKDEIYWLTEEMEGYEKMPNVKKATLYSWTFDSVYYFLVLKSTTPLQPHTYFFFSVVCRKIGFPF